MTDKRAAPFKGSTKFAIRHIPTQRYYNTARYAKGFCKTPSFKVNSKELFDTILYWCDDTKVDREFYANYLGINIDYKRTDFEVVEFTLIETGTQQHR
jgi:hypothetical protein